MGKMKQIAIETQEERELFERMNTSQETSIPLQAVLEMREYIHTLEALVRELGDRLAELEGKK